jgi:hypothetical protein
VLISGVCVEKVFTVITPNWSSDCVSDDVVSSVKFSFAAMEYNSIEFYCLQPDMLSGSRELLLAMGWLMLTSNVLEVSTNRKLRVSPMNMEYDFKVNQVIQEHSK